MERSMKHHFIISAIVPLVCLLATSCDTAPKSNTGKSHLADDGEVALQQAKHADASLDGFLRTSSGYAVFPHVAKGAAVVGGSYGRGTVYAGNEVIGYADITQATVGLQAGGEEFREIVVFESQADLNRFTAGKLALAANLSAVALKTPARASERRPRTAPASPARRYRTCTRSSSCSAATT